MIYECREQLAWDLLEEAALHLHFIEGIERALYRALDEALSQVPDRGQEVYALLEAIARFRADAQVRVAAGLRQLFAPGSE